MIMEERKNQDYMKLVIFRNRKMTPSLAPSPSPRGREGVGVEVGW